MSIHAARFSITRLKWNALSNWSRVARRNLFGKHLLLTNVCISTSLAAAGDFLQQHYEILIHRRDKWDKKRTIHMSVTGFVIGFICHFWYIQLDKKFPGRTLRIVSKKLLVDQIFFSPLLIAVFFGTVGVLEHSSTDEVCHEIKSKAWRLYAAEWIVWPPAQIINFCWLPTRFRVLYDNVISLGYDIYTSYVKHDKSNFNNRL